MVYMKKLKWWKWSGRDGFYTKNQQSWDFRSIIWRPRKNHWFSSKKYMRHKIWASNPTEKSVESLYIDSLQNKPISAVQVPRAFVFSSFIFFLLLLDLLPRSIPDELLFNTSIIRRPRWQYRCDTPYSTRTRTAPLSHRKHNVIHSIYEMRATREYRTGASPPDNNGPFAVVAVRDEGRDTLREDFLFTSVNIYPHTHTHTHLFSNLFCSQIHKLHKSWIRNILI